jgi:hypothetical protein
VPCKGRVFFPKDFFLLTRPQFSWNFISYQESVSLIEIFLLEMGFLSLSLSLSLSASRARINISKQERSILFYRFNDRDRYLCVDSLCTALQNDVLRFSRY